MTTVYSFTSQLVDKHIVFTTQREDRGAGGGRRRLGRGMLDAF